MEEVKADVNIEESAKVEVAKEEVNIEESAKLDVAKGEVKTEVAKETVPITEAKPEQPEQTSETGAVSTSLPRPRRERRPRRRRTTDEGRWPEKVGHLFYCLQKLWWLSPGTNNSISVPLFFHFELVKWGQWLG